MIPLLTLFTLPTEALASTTAYIGDVFSGVGALLWLAIGVPLGFYVIKKVMTILPKK
jgi:hypothetical protein